jgi:hypothetical protein
MPPLAEPTKEQEIKWAVSLAWLVLSKALEEEPLTEGGATYAQTAVMQLARALPHVLGVECAGKDASELLMPVVEEWRRAMTEGQ